MLSETRHLNDDQLMEVYVLAAPDAHIVACATCQERFDQLAGALDGMRNAAVLDADASFTPEKLHEQRDRIMRRIERHDHPGEVLMFPSRTAVRQSAVQRVFGPARRWVAGAAAAGLAAGMFLGFALDRRTHDVALSSALPQATAGPLAWQTPADSAPDEFFAEIEAALIDSRPRVMRPDLDAIDVMTTPLEIREASYPQ